ncbi:MAG: HAMP domain-containing protein [Candidatus Niyogibacteria bacterium]|nr:HAMP domain-containing protein [Candidatus Niyogibacteria bacterium]
MSSRFNKIWQAFKRKKAIFVARHPGLKSISFKLTFIIFLLSVVPLLVASYLIFSYVKADLRSQIIESQVLIAEAQEGHVFSFLESLKGKTLDLTYNTLISRLLEKIANKKPDSEQAAQELNTYLSFIRKTFNNRIYGINVIDKNGVVVASTDAREIGRDERQDDYFSQTIGLDRGQVFLSDIVTGHHFVEGKNPFLVVASPLVGEQDGKTIGVVTEYFKTHYLDDLLSGKYQEALGAISGILGRNKTLDIYLVNKDKLLITKSRFLGVESFLTQVVDTDPVRACLSGREEAVGMWNNYLGDRVLGAAMCLPNLGWTLVVEKHEQEAFQLMAALTKNVNTFIFLIIALVAAFGIYIARKITRPMVSLSRVIQEIIQGNFHMRSRVDSQDEIGALSGSFNQMLDKLDGASAQLAAEKNKLSVILDSLPVPVDIVDEQRTILYANEAFKRLFGECAAGDKCYLKIKDDKKICENCPLKEGIEKMKGVRSIEVGGVGGGKIYLIVSHATFKDVSQETRVVEVFLDVTKEREVERMKTEFVSVASHQLRTPLTAIKLFAEILKSEQSDNLNKSQKDYLENIYKSTDRMVQLVNELLSVSRLETGRLTVTPKLAQLEDLMSAIIKETSSLAESKQCVVTFREPKKKLAPIPIDTSLLRQIIGNLVHNAIVYSEPGKKCQVEVLLEQDKSDALITVIDQGVGIPKDEQPRIFEKFFRASNAVRAEASGTGLGLFITKTIIEGFGGKIWFESAVGKGTTFYVIIPMSGMREKNDKK